MYTVGLKQVLIGPADETGAIAQPAALTKQFKVYDGTCQISQDAPEVTEHKEENSAIPFLVIKDKKPIKVQFQVVDDDNAVNTLLAEGAEVEGNDTEGWGYDGTEDVPNRYFKP